jgi:hypothetical protein
MYSRSNHIHLTNPAYRSLLWGWRVMPCWGATRGRMIVCIGGKMLYKLTIPDVSPPDPQVSMLPLR